MPKATYEVPVHFLLICVHVGSYLLVTHRFETDDWSLVDIAGGSCLGDRLMYMYMLFNGILHFYW